MPEETKQKKLEISLVIPSYNDEETIVSHIKTCEKIVRKYAKKYEILVGDDNSFDNTQKLLKKYFGKNKNVTIIANERNLGITKNIRNLYAKAKFEFVFYYSADGDWNPKETEKLIQACVKDNADIVIGMRRKKGGYNFYRRFVSYMHNFLPRFLFGVDTVDAGAIKIFKKELYSNKLISKGQFFEAEMIIRAINSGKKVSLVPLHYNKPPMKPGFGGNYLSVLNSLEDVIRLRLLY